MEGGDSMRKSVREDLARTYFPSLNHGIILGLTDDRYDDTSKVYAGKYGNSTVKAVSYKSLDLENFPLVEDLYVDLESSLVSFGKGEDSAKHLDIFLRFRSFEHGSPKWLLAIEFWDNDMHSAVRGMRRNEYFLGTQEMPYSDAGQGYNYYIFEKGNYVYIISGIEAGEPYFPVWFKVRKEKYLSVLKGIEEGWKKSRASFMERKYGFLGKLYSMVT